ncbi:MAG TPA: outer membrane protein assembly factor BamD [Thermoanaerobaculia bacterium]|nr:outer membrane protein assembly factor BamD [Thermoanaerobaculia bacterium]
MIHLEDTSRQGPRPFRLAAGSVAAAILLFAAACSSGPKKPDKTTLELLNSPKEVLFEKGKALLAKKKFEDGRKYLNFVFETYPNDPEGRQSLLLVADSYFRQAGTTGYTEARFRYRDYLNRYPGAPQRDYARYQFAYCYDKEHEKSDRDQTSTREALQQYQVLIQEYPNSTYVTVARERIRRLTDSLADHEFGVGYFYMRKGSPSAALQRWASLEQRFPEYSGKDKLFFYQAEALRRLRRDEEAARFYSRVIEEFPASQYAKTAKGRVPKLKVQPASASVDTSAKN